MQDQTELVLYCCTLEYFFLLHTGILEITVFWSKAAWWQTNLKLCLRRYHTNMLFINLKKKNMSMSTYTKWTQHPIIPTDVCLWNIISSVMTVNLTFTQSSGSHAQSSDPAALLVFQQSPYFPLLLLYWAVFSQAEAGWLQFTLPFPTPHSSETVTCSHHSDTWKTRAWRLRLWITVICNLVFFWMFVFDKRTLIPVVFLFF